MRRIAFTAVCTALLFTLCGCNANSTNDGGVSAQDASETASTASEDMTEGSSFEGLPDRSSHDGYGVATPAMEQSLKEYSEEHGTILQYTDSSDSPVALESFQPEDVDRVVIGSDNRITVSDTSLYPFLSIAYIEAKATCGCEWTGSGYMVRPTVMMTAAHCLWCEEHQQPATMMNFYFGYQPNGDYAYSYNGYYETWYGTKHPDTEREWDYGIVHFHDNVGNAVGWFGVDAQTDSELNGGLYRMAGYRDGLLKFDSSSVSVTNDYLFTYKADTVRGNSGGPVYDSSNNYASGIIVAEYLDGSNNVGCRITQDIIDKVLEVEGSKKPSGSHNQLVVKPSDTGTNGYVLPYSQSYRYTRSDLAGLTVWELYIARNEIAARHGYIFGREDLKNYFGAKSWYRGTLTPEQFTSIEGILNAIEEDNIDTILAMEHEMGSKYAPK